MFIRALKSGLAIAAFAFPTWVSAMDNPVTLTVLKGWRQADGTHMAAIKLDLEKGWKTYWRKPGDAGIPPFFDFLGSGNLIDFDVKWPTPTVFDQGGLTSVGYKDSVILPIILTPKKPNRDVKLRGIIDIGVCKEICLPLSLDINVRLDADQTDRSPVISAALASVPFTQTEAGVKSAVCKLTFLDGVMAVSTDVAMPSAGGAEHVILESANDDHWLSDATSSRSGGSLRSSGELASLSGGTVALNRSDIRITVLGRDHAVDIQGCTGS